MATHFADSALFASFCACSAAYLIGQVVFVKCMAARRDARKKHVLSRGGLADWLLLFAITTVLPVANSVMHKDRETSSKPVEGRGASSVAGVGILMVGCAFLM